MRRLPLLLWLPLSLLVIAAPAAYGQVTIAPTFVHIDDQQPVGTFQVINRGGTAQEVVLSTQFGYHASDAEGRRYLEYADSVSEAAHALTPHLRIFPKKMVLEPGASQIVRLMVKPSAELPDGLYWTRLVTTTREQAVFDVNPDRAISAGLSVEMKQVIPVLFGKGALRTAVAFTGLDVRADAAGLSLHPALERTGAVPFIGRLGVQVVDEAGREVEALYKQTVVYFGYVEELHLDRDRYRPGRYTARFRLEPTYRGVRSGVLPAMAPVEVAFPFEVPEAQETALLD